MISYSCVDDVVDIIERDDIVLDGIYQVNFVLSKWGIVPELFNYPKELELFLGRKVWTDTINSIASDDKKWSAGWFVKPIKEKVFTGRVVKSLSDLVGCGSCYENYEVICSESIDIKREWRVFIRYDEILDIKPYKGDWHYNYDPNFVDKMLESFKLWKDRPSGCAFDIGVTSDNKTVLVEVNDGYALGCYGLDSILYAKLISARWSQLLSREDELNFQ